MHKRGYSCGPAGSEGVEEDLRVIEACSHDVASEEGDSEAEQWGGE